MSLIGITVKDYLEKAAAFPQRFLLKPKYLVASRFGFNK